jgi:hypothetical protein
MILKRNGTKHEYADFVFCTVNTIFPLGQDIRAQTQHCEKFRLNLSLHCNTIDQANVSINVQDKRLLRVLLKSDTRRTILNG